jgi:hypothetical protein
MRWTVTEADRDSDGRIWVTPPARTLADLLPAKPEGENTPRQPWRPGKMEIAGIVGGVVLAASLIAALNVFAPAPGPVARPTATAAATAAATIAPTPTMALQNAYASPEGALMGSLPLTSTLRYQHSGYPGWAGIEHDGAIVWVRVEDAGQLVSLPDLKPAPTSIPRPAQRPVEAPQAAPAPVVESCDSLNPPYQVRQQVGGLGHVVGFSCSSAEEAQANADMLAAQMRAAAQPSPTPAPSGAR